MYYFRSIDEIKEDLTHKAQHHRKMQKRWLSAIDNRQPGELVHFHYMTPVGINEAKRQLTSHAWQATAYEDALSMLEGLDQ